MLIKLIHVSKKEAQESKFDELCNANDPFNCEYYDEINFHCKEKDVDEYNIYILY